MKCIILTIICICIVLIHFYVGLKNIRRLESVCSEIVTANITKVEKHKFFFCNYYGLVLEYNYNGKEYGTKKALFKEIEDNKTINLHINPKNPSDCYLIPIRERCRCK